jgi:hypothetical protein
MAIMLERRREPQSKNGKSVIKVEMRVHNMAQKGLEAIKSPVAKMKERMEALDRVSLPTRFKNKKRFLKQQEAGWRRP